MDDFRFKVGLIMSGAAPRPSVIPAVDGLDRKTLRRGDTGDAVAKVQTAVGVAADGTLAPRPRRLCASFNAGTA